MKAAYVALNAGIVGATVYQHAPAGAALPVVIVGDMDDARKLSGKGSGASREIPLSIVTITEGEERAACAKLQFQVEQILDGAKLTVGSFAIRPFLLGSSCILAEDGLGYIGLSQFKVFALAG